MLEKVHLLSKGKRMTNQTEPMIKPNFMEQSLWDRFLASTIKDEHKRMVYDDLVKLGDDPSELKARTTSLSMLLAIKEETGREGYDPAGELIRMDEATNDMTDAELTGFIEHETAIKNLVTSFFLNEEGKYSALTLFQRCYKLKEVLDDTIVILNQSAAKLAKDAYSDEETALSRFNDAMKESAEKLGIDLPEGFSVDNPNTVVQ